MYGCTDVRTEFLPILQDFVPRRGRCPAALCNFTASKKQGKGTADLKMPFVVLLFISISSMSLTCDVLFSSVCLHILKVVDAFLSVCKVLFSFIHLFVLKVFNASFSACDALFSFIHLHVLNVFDTGRSFIFCLSPRPERS